MEFIAGILAGIVISFAFFVYKVRKFAEKYESELQTLFTKLERGEFESGENSTDNSESNYVELEVVREQGAYYLFAAADNKFICQGTTVDEIVEAFQTRCPNKRPKIVEGKKEDIQALKELVKESL